MAQTRSRPRVIVTGENDSLFNKLFELSENTLALCIKHDAFRNIGIYRDKDTPVNIILCPDGNKPLEKQLNSIERFRDNHPNTNIIIGVICENEEMKKKARQLKLFPLDEPKTEEQFKSALTDLRNKTCDKEQAEVFEAIDKIALEALKNHFVAQDRGIPKIILSFFSTTRNEAELKDLITDDQLASDVKIIKDKTDIKDHELNNPHKIALFLTHSKDEDLIKALKNHLERLISNKDAQQTTTLANEFKKGLMSKFCIDACEKHLDKLKEKDNANSEQKHNGPKK